MEGIAFLRQEVQKLRKLLHQVQGQVSRLIGGSLFTIRSFDTVADMLASDSTTWSSAECWNYAAGDDIMSVWIKSSDPTRLPNGVDILQTTGPAHAGINLVRIYVREPDTGIVVPGGSMASYTVTVPVVVPTVTDLQNSLFSAELVWVGDPTRPIVFVRGNDNADNDGVNGVLNAAGVHYDRVRFE